MSYLRLSGTRFFVPHGVDAIPSLGWRRGDPTDIAFPLEGTAEEWFARHTEVERVLKSASPRFRMVGGGGAMFVPPRFEPPGGFRPPVFPDPGKWPTGYTCPDADN